ncbi:MAG: hypothetical protein ABIY55_15645 [Kofleriaceae bacterium]
MIERTSLASLLLTLAACGSNPPHTTTATSAPTPAGGAQEHTEGQVAVGHFRSPDGMIGLVLDRTDKPKLKVDGQSEIIELTQKEDREHGRLRGYILEAPDGKHPIYLSTGGGIRYHRNGDDFDMLFDKKVEPLGAATVTGTYVKPKAGWEMLSEKLTAVSVRKRFPALKAEDSALPDKISEAIDKATPDMVVHYVSQGATSWLPHLEAAPDSIHGIGYGGVAHNTDDKWEPGKGAGLVKYGGKMAGFFEPDNSFNHTNVMRMKGYPAPLVDNTPGLVWEVDSSTAIFVAFDGGRYRIDLTQADKGPALEMGAGAKASWPTAVQDTLLDISMVSQLSKAGALPDKPTEELEALDTRWNDCTQKAWRNGPQKKLESHKGMGRAMSEAEYKAAIEKVKTGCKKHVQDEEKIFVKLIEERTKTRQALLDKAKAKL